MSQSEGSYSDDEPVCSANSSNGSEAWGASVCCCCYGAYIVDRTDDDKYIV